MQNANLTENKGLSPYLSKYAVCALGVGVALGWGCLMVTSNTYLAQAGPLGSTLGLLIGMVVMLIISYNYAYMIKQYPYAGGIYDYTKTIFGYDRAYIVFWYSSLTYMAMFWANATSLPLFMRYFVGDTFRFAKLFNFFGYDVFLGEALLSLTAILIFTWLCTRSKRIAAHVMVILVAVFSAGITISFIVAMFKHPGTGFSFEPGYIPDGNTLMQTVRIAFISPWAFAGLESISYSAEEFKFKRGKIFRILLAAVVSTTLLYIFVTLLSITAYPEQYGSWLEYINDLGNLSGLAGVPAFYAANYYLGDLGTVLLMLSLLALIFSSLIGNMRALSRLFYAAAKDGILPERYAELNSIQIPARAMHLVAAISLVVPFIGRTAIGWIVDVTTIGATLMYGFVSAAAWKSAKAYGDKKEKTTGIIGTVIMVIFAVYLIFPNLIAGQTLEKETYFIFVVWTIVGLLYFRSIISKDQSRNFGKAIIVWITLLSLVFFMSMIWTSRSTEDVTNETVATIQEYYDGVAEPELLAMEEDAFIDMQVNRIHTATFLSAVAVLGLFALALGAMLINYLSMRRWEARTAQERDSARAAAYVDALTGVKSKNAYAEREQEINAMIAEGTAGPFEVVVCDVNGLKHINDTYGHKAGDKYIKDAAMMICRYFKRSPVYRIGGDEFVVITGEPDHSGLQTIVSELNAEIEGNVGTDNVVVSVGVSAYEPISDRSVHAIFERADALMYERKLELKAKGARVRD